MSINKTYDIAVDLTQIGSSLFVSGLTATTQQVIGVGFLVGPTGPPGPSGAGVGIPTGGSAGQFMKKTGAADFATGWATITENDVSGLTASLAATAFDAAVVHLTGNETVAGVKTFSLSPIVPSNSFPESAVTNLVADLSARLIGANNLSDVTNSATAFSNVKQDATSSTTGVILLTNDLGGTATAPLTKSRSWHVTVGPLGSGSDYTVTGTNDSATVQAALTAAAGASIYFKAATYDINATVTVPAATFIGGDYYGVLFVVHHSAELLINNPNIKLQNIRLDGSLQSGNDHLIHVTNTSDIKLDGLTIQNAMAFGIFIDATGSNTTSRIWLSNSRLTGLGHADVIGGGPGNSTGAVVKEIFIDKVYVTQDTTQLGSSTYNNALDIVASDTVKVHNSIFEGNVVFGIEQFPKDSCEIFDVHIKPAPGISNGGITVQTNGSATSQDAHIKISRVTIDKGRIQLTGISTEKIDTCQITDCTIKVVGNSENGIDLFNCNNVMLCRNDVQGAGTNLAAIKLQACTYIYAYQNVLHNSYYGIRDVTGDSRVYVFENTFISNTTNISGVAGTVFNNPGNNDLEATTTSEGILQLAGDLGGTATSPTVTNLHLAADTAINHRLTSLIDPTNAQDAATKNYVDIGLGLKAPLASPTFTGTVTVPTPVNATDASTKAYVDSVAQGLSVKPSAIVATTTGLPTYSYSSGTITMAATGAVTIDGHTLALNDVVLVKDETSINAPYNGLYTVSTAGAVGTACALTRHTSMDAATEFSGGFVFVEIGTVNAAAGFVCINSGMVTVGTTNITFTQFSGAGEITAGAGLSKSGNVLSIDSTVATLTDAQVLTHKDMTDASNTWPTFNQSTTGSAATLTTPRAIYGNNFNGSAALDQIIASTYGGTGNGFTKFSGPTTAERTFTLPDASAAILTDNTAVTVAQGGTGTGTAFTAGSVAFAGASGVYSQDNANLFWDAANHRLGISTTAPSKPLSLGGEAARTIWMERRTASNVAGNSLTINSGGATSGATNKAAGDLILGAGVSTGTGGAVVRIQTMTKALSSGTGNNSPTDRIIAQSPLSVTNNSATTLFSMTLASGSIVAGFLRYVVEVTDGTEYQVEEGVVAYHVTNKAGTIANNAVTKSGNQQVVTSGTLSVTFSITAASPALIQVNANSSLTPSTGYPRVTCVLENLTQQAVGVS